MVLLLPLESSVGPKRLTGTASSGSALPLEASIGPKWLNETGSSSSGTGPDFHDGHRRGPCKHTRAQRSLMATTV